MTDHLKKDDKYRGKPQKLHKSPKVFYLFILGNEKKDAQIRMLTCNSDSLITFSTIFSNIQEIHLNFKQVIRTKK